MIEAARVYRILRFGLLGVTMVLVVSLAYRYRIVSVTPFCDTVAPNLTGADRVLVDRWPMWRDRLELGDLVAYELLLADDRRARYFAAVGATPGATLENRDGKLWVDDVPTEFAEVPIADETPRVPEGMYLLLNTNARSMLPDSRNFGFVDRRAIFGRVGVALPF